MIDTPNSNVSLSFEQLQAIDTTEKRLNNLENEVAIATRNLRGIKLETERAYKEKLYQEELCAEVTKNVDTMKTELSDLETKVHDSIEILNKLREEVKSESLDHEAKSTELKNLEFVIAKKETELCNKEIALNKAIQILNTDKIEFNSKVAKLKEVSSIL